MIRPHNQTVMNIKTNSVDIQKKCTCTFVMIHFDTYQIYFIQVIYIYMYIRIYKATAKNYETIHADMRYCTL